MLSLKRGRHGRAVVQRSSSSYLARRMNQLMSRILSFSLCFVVSVHFGIGEAHQIQTPPPEQTQEGQPEQPVFRTGINFVRVDVIRSGAS